MLFDSVGLLQGLHFLLDYITNHQILYRAKYVQIDAQLSIQYFKENVSLCVGDDVPSFLLICGRGCHLSDKLSDQIKDLICHSPSR
jgi:hypothetical protein